MNPSIYQKMDHLYLALCVGGQMFYIRAALLRTIPRTLLAELVDASLPPDLIFGGRAIPADDDTCRFAKFKGKVKTVEEKIPEGDPSELNSNDAPVKDSHPFDRAKYVYLSCSNTFRPFEQLSTSSTTAPPPATTSTTAGKRAISVSSGATFPPQARGLFLPATCLTSPRHKAVSKYGHRSSNNIQGFTNKSFLNDEEPPDKTKISNLNLPPNATSDLCTQAAAENHSKYPDDEYGGKLRGTNEESDSNKDLMPYAVPLPQAIGADIYVDRSPLLVPYILDLYRHGELHLPPNVCSLTIRMELDFWKIPEELIGECCWREFQSGLDRMEVVRSISATLTNRFDDPEVRAQLTKTGRFWLTMERPDYSKRAKDILRTTNQYLTTGFSCSYHINTSRQDIPAVTTSIPSGKKSPELPLQYLAKSCPSNYHSRQDTIPVTT
ncbi:potassium voltage-gated channel protein shaw [Plakobranchus ocellatus]|uniref:Potassium voltage-gated channel protein shaw n=1 Tax=Plakobranchus ocellatus TaxID=259542 RepID=A0AAV4DGR6_9GAST|nr:potassium voltage-gated channel protein shaw [Plakobranchus ocellatus]